LGIEANAEKCRAIINMMGNKSIKVVQRLIGRLRTISRFLPRLAEKTKPILKLLNWMGQRLPGQVRGHQSWINLPLVLQKLNTSRPFLVYIVAI